MTEELGLEQVDEPGEAFGGTPKGATEFKMIRTTGCEQSNPFNMNERVPMNSIST